MQASDLIALVPDCCSEVLESMYFTVVLSADYTPASCAYEVTDYHYRLRFEGEVCGTFGLCVNAGIARSLAANFLGEEEQTLSCQEISETMGELSNMLCGSVVSRASSVRTFALSHPERILRERFTQEDTVNAFHLQIDAGHLTVWIAIDGDSPGEVASSEGL